MYIFQHAMKNIGRNKGRNLLMGIIVLVIIIATVISLIINNTSGRIIDDYKTQFGSKVSLAPDLEQMYSKGADYEKVTSEQYLEFAHSEYLSQSTFSAVVPSVSDTVKAVDQDNDPKGGNIKLQGPGGASKGNPTMKLVGNSNLETLVEFSDGQRSIVEGEMYKNPDESIVSKEFAELNDISVGDTIEVNSVMGEGNPYTLTVTGIYLDSTAEYGDMPMEMSFMNRRNEILTSFDTVMGDDPSSASAVNIQATYFLKSPDLLPDFEKEVRDKGLPGSYTVSTDEESYAKVVGPVEAMKGIFLTFMIVVIILGSIILALLSSITIRERKYEIGVLRAMGMKKGKVAAGLISEALMITAVCLVVGLAIGSALSQPTANTILQNQIEAAEQAKAASGPGKILMVGGQSNMSNVTTPPISQIDVGLGMDTLLQIALIALLLAAVSSVMSISRITKYEPIKILMERN